MKEYVESIEDFYNSVPDLKNDFIKNIERKHFNILPRWRCQGTFTRRDYYKLALVIGTGIIHYADKRICIDRPALFLVNPVIPYSWEPISDKQEGWICLFTEDFIHSKEISYIKENPVFFLKEENYKNIYIIFEKMIEEIKSEYVHKYDVLSNYLQILLHEIQKEEVESELGKTNFNAAHRTTFRFLELLERQFPVESPENPLVLKKSRDFAMQLSVHVNHLNYSVKSITGKTTHQIIADSIIHEAKALLKNSNWNISEIGYALGFEYLSHFTTFFRKQTGITPKEFRL